MKVSGLVAAAVFASGLFVQPVAHAQTVDENALDIRCMVVALGMIAMQDAQLRQQGSTAMMYFLGRLDARAPGYDLENAIYTANKAMSQAERATEAQRCGGMLITRGQQLVEMGQRISEREARDAR